MDSLKRIQDANINRAAEGLRVIEDIARFHLNDEELSRTARGLRHQIRNIQSLDPIGFLDSRRASEDVGAVVSANTSVDTRESIMDLIMANFKRVQEAVRSIEESLKLDGGYNEAKIIEKVRFDTYTFEKVFLSRLSATSRRNKVITDIYGITGEEYSRGRNNIEVVKELIDSGIKVIQYREKDKSLKEKYEQCVEIRKLTEEAGVTFIINDHIDLALMVKADGVHIGQDDLPIQEVRKVVGSDMIIGLSSHSPEQANKSIADGADYIGVGPIYKTFTKKDVCDPVGLEYLRYAVENVKIPFVAIGGIKEHNLHEVVENGAKCVCLVTEIVGAEDIGAKIKDLRRIMK